ncbi:MAG: glutamine-hydrolyzing carbamoyl-phosphate synthase small subunit [Bacteroidota bacterium]|nr:glutamine-hydrolyzing carbamoyl-phosphate synthase small subunit [Bacteroidota bacterium]
MKKTEAKLVLSDGSIFSGYSFGYPINISGEIVFNTGMVGYPETMTDPSYKGQILVFTYPLIGNYGVPADTLNPEGMKINFESDSIQCSAIVVSELSEEFEHYTSVKSLNDWMYENKIPGITGIDTRMLTKRLREAGTMPAKIIVDDKIDIDFEDPNSRDLAGEVSTKEIQVYEKGPKKIVLVDCGTKNNIINAFLLRDITVIRVPYDYDFTTMEYDGVLISNGPGDPKKCVKTIIHIQKILNDSKPVLGICLGCQILALAAGGDTYKLKYGHRGLNQPAVEVGTKKCYITSQNHGYAVDAKTLPQDWREWFINDNDGTNEGIFHISKPLFGSQFHPEASPGPDDSEFIFDMFIRALKQRD